MMMICFDVDADVFRIDINVHTRLRLWSILRTKSKFSLSLHREKEKGCYFQRYFSTYRQIVCNLETNSFKLTWWWFVFWSQLNLIQGGWENDESIEDAALRETVEEAGVVGDVEVGSFPLNFLFQLL